MAAPMLSKGGKVKGSGKSKKPKVKNVLFGKIHEWPTTTKDVEESILSKLSEVLRSLPNIFKPVRSSTKADQETKRKVRAQLELGTNCVLRAIEKDRLACVLVSSKTTPQSTVEPVVAIARERGCPLLCLDALGTTLAKVTKSKCFPMCIGFKKLIANAKADFIDVIALVQNNAKVDKAHPSLSKKLDGDGKENSKKTIKALSEDLRPARLDPGTDEAVLVDLKRIFKNAAVKDTEAKMWTSKDKKRKKNKKTLTRLKQHYQRWFHAHFESGKNTVGEFVARGKIQLVLVIPELVPVLMSEPPASSFLCVARSQDCPVLCVSNLASVACATTTKALAVLGIKRDNELPMNTPSAFSAVIEKCTHFLRTVPMPVQDMDTEVDDQLHDSLHPEKMAADSSGQDIMEEKEDYSFLYVKKKDSAEHQETAKKRLEEQKSTSTDSFISFSSGAIADSAPGKRKKDSLILPARLKPKKMLLDSQPEKPESQTSGNVFGNASGFLSFSSLEKSNVADEEMAADEKSATVFGSSSTGKAIKESVNFFALSRSGDQSGRQEDSTSTAADKSSVLGLNSDPASAEKEEDEHVTNVFSATKTVSKNATKNRHGQDGFLSFAYSEANIHTMVANPSRKKKGKK